MPWTPPTEGAFVKAYSIPPTKRDDAAYEGNLIAKTHQAATEQGWTPTGTLDVQWLEANDEVVLRVELTVTRS